MEFLFPVSAFDKAEHHKTTLHSILIKVFWPQIRDGYINVFSVSTLYRRKGLRAIFFALLIIMCMNILKIIRWKCKTMLLCMVFVETLHLFFSLQSGCLCSCSFYPFNRYKYQTVTFCFLLLFCIAASRVFYYGFVKYYRRYSLEVLMAFAVLQHDKKLRQFHHDLKHWHPVSKGARMMCWSVFY